MNKEQQSQDITMQQQIYPTLPADQQPPAAVQAAPVIVQMVGPVNVGPKPSMVTCPTCQKTILTTVRHKITGRTHLFAFLLCICSCWPCCLLPYIMNSCRNANHYCPSCNSYIGSYQAM